MNSYDIRITLPKVRRLLREAVAGRETHTASYVYAASGAPVCIVGEVLHRAGVSVEDLYRLNSAGHIYRVAPILRDCGVVLTPQALNALALAQQVQDSYALGHHPGNQRKRTWGEALAAVERV